MASVEDVIHRCPPLLAPLPSLSRASEAKAWSGWASRILISKTFEAQ